MFLFILISIILISCESYKLNSNSFFKKSLLLEKTLVKLNDANKDFQKEQQFRLQQEMLARRKNKKEMDKYFESVEKKRKEVDVKVKETIYTKINDKEGKHSIVNHHFIIIKFISFIIS